MNKLKTSYDVKLPRELSIKNSQISVFPGFLKSRSWRLLQKKL